MPEAIPGFSCVADIDKVRTHGYTLNPGRYVGGADIEDDDGPFEDRFGALKKTLETQFSESDSLTSLIRAQLAEVGGDE